jgi:hypothetical protein
MFNYKCITVSDQKKKSILFLLTFLTKKPKNMIFSITGQGNDDLLIQVTLWASLAILLKLYPCLVYKDIYQPGDENKLLRRVQGALSQR